ncbi:MAG: Ig-like domain-containing protein [Sedimentisphaerales bacterium]|nr:Ig-like domain-containing protein [Sedimentisphaerales bacterium]
MTGFRMVVLWSLVFSAGICFEGSLAGAGQGESARVAVSWFTDAKIEGAVRLKGPSEGLPVTDGTEGQGVDLTRAVPVENPLLQRESGQISFWIQPHWDGGDGKRHVLLRIGDPQANGLLVEKSERNMLRYVMAGPKKVTASRVDVSHWRSGQWHQVTVAWFSKDGEPYGLPLFLDEHLPGRGGPEPVDGPVAAGNTFLDPGRMSDRRLWIGDETADATMDELIVRAEMGNVYRDYYRTAPFARMTIDHAPNYARSDRRVIAGHAKQFGLRAEIRGQERAITEFTQRYGQWGENDARSLVQWETSNPAVATVDKDGLVTGLACGRCQLTATFRGLKAEYDLHVISAEQADLTVMYLSRLPRYRCDAAKSAPAPGDRVQTVAHVGNYGFKSVPAGTVIQMDLIPDADKDFRLDPDEKSIFTQTNTIDRTLEPYQRAEIRFDWEWTNEPVWVRVTADPRDEVEEFCRVNNTRYHLSTARPTRIRLDRALDRKLHKERTINLVGSFCYYDYAQVQFECLDGMLRDAVYPTTSPIGVEDSHTIDGVYEFEAENDEGWKAFDEEAAYYPSFHVHLETILMAQNSGALHEGGHNVFKLPDLYGYHTGDVLLRDETGRLYTETPLLPKSRLLGPAACGPYYSSFMDYCHLWLHPANAGKMQYFGGYGAEERFWGAQGRLIATRRNLLQIFDRQDGPLANAAVYVYHVTHAQEQRRIVDPPKFVGHTDRDGQFVFPGRTDRHWDDPRTDQVEGSIPVWNPFGRPPSPSWRLTLPRACQGVFTDTGRRIGKKGVDGSLVLPILLDFTPQLKGVGRAGKYIFWRIRF